MAQSGAVTIKTQVAMTDLIPDIAIVATVIGTLAILAWWSYDDETKG